MSIISKLVVKGNVPIGYRAYVKQLAYKLLVKGTVKYISNRNIEIYCNAPDEETYNKFKKQLEEFKLKYDKYKDIKGIEEHLKDSDGYGEWTEEWMGFRFLYGENDPPIEELVEEAALVWFS